MTTESSPPLVGFNNNVRYRGMRFHIQTEDSGVRRPHIITHLFADGGHIIKSLRTDYAELVDRPDRPAVIHKMMRDQHRAMALDLRDGRLDATIDGLARGAPPPDSSPEAAESPPRRVLPPPERPAGCVTHVPMTIAEELADAPAAPDVRPARAVAASKAAPPSEAPPTSRSTPSSKRATPSVSPDTSRSVSPSVRPPSSRGSASSRRPPASSGRSAVSSPSSASAKHVPTLGPPPSSRNAGKGQRTRRSGELDGSRAAEPPSAPITEQSRDAESRRSGASNRRASPQPETSGGRKRSRSSAAPGTKRAPASSRKGGRPAPATSLPAKPSGESIFGALPQESLDDVILSYVSSTKGPPSRRPK